MSDYSPFSAPLAQAPSWELKGFYSISEGWHVEYKSRPLSPKDSAKSLSSFANQYGGWLLFGVVENKRDLTAQEFPGLSEEQVSNVVRTLRDASRDCVNPEVYYEHRVFNGPIKEIDLPAGKSIVVVHVPQGPEPPYVHADARIYRRVGDSSAPRPETDRSILDRLSSRAQQFSDRLEQMAMRVPVTSKSEENNCYLHMTITSDPHEIAGHWFGGKFEDFSNIMQQDPIPFDNIYTRAGGFVARQVSGRDPYNRLLTWDFDRHCHSFITLPINVLNTRDETFLEYNTASSFAALINPIESSALLSARLLDLNLVFKATWAIAMVHRKLAANANIYGPFYFKSYIENAWRKIPFLDMPSFLSQVQKFGIPVVQEDDVLAPPGTDLNSFETLSLSEDHDEQAADSPLLASDALKMSMPIFDALGIPSDIILQASGELVALSNFNSVADE